MTIKKAHDILEKIVDRAYDEHCYIQATNERENDAIETACNWIGNLMDEVWELESSGVEVDAFLKQHLAE